MLDRTYRRPLCRVKSCRNGNSETRDLSEKVFHFPRGKGPTKEAAIGWLQFINDFENLECFLTTGDYNSKLRLHGICQRHFAPHQFVTPDKTRLNRGAIPLIHNPDDVSAANLQTPWKNINTRLTTETCGESTSSGVCKTDYTNKGNNTHLLKEEMKAFIEEDNSQLNQPQEYAVEVAQEDGILLDSEYPEAAVCDEPGKFIPAVKSYSKTNNECTSSLSDYIEDESKVSYECQEMESTELGLSAVKWDPEISCESEETVPAELGLSFAQWEVLPGEMCRLCASKDEHLKQPISIWVKMLNKLIPNLVDVNDGLPQYICRSCAEKLYMCIKIKQSFIASYEKLKSEFTRKQEYTEPEIMSDYPDYNNATAPDSEDNDNPILCDTVDSEIYNNDISNNKLEEVAVNSTGKKKKKKVKKYSFICMECEELFFSPKALKIHMKTNHDIVKCEYCNRYFMDTSELQEHVRTHTVGTQFKCQCGTQVQSIKHLKNHLINHRPPKFNCSVCCKSFHNFFEMKHHEKRHKKSICEICGKQMKNDTYLKVHVRLHTGEKPFQCEFCGVSFPASDRYYIHRNKKHSNEQFPCDICGKVLFTELSFERHKLGHEKGKQHRCEVCLLDFRYEFSKCLHQRAKCSTWLCVVCNLIFSDVQELLEHRSEAHLEEETTSAAYAYRNSRTYNCNICSKSFKKSDSLSKHITKVHRKQKKPSVLSPDESIQKKPRKIFNCTKCEKKFKTNKALMLHSASYHDDENHSFSCSNCKEQFGELNALIAHESQHLKEKAFSCCGWMFCSKADFVRHKRLHSQNISDIQFEDENYEEAATELNIVLPSHVLA